MSVFASFLEHVGRLVHPSAQMSDLERTRHSSFLISRFCLFFLAMAAWLLSLVTGSVPGLWETLAVAWLTVPFLAAAHVSRTGRLADGELACILAWIGLAMTTTLAGGTSLVGGCVILLIAPLEASFSGQRSLVNRAIAAAAVAAAVLGLVGVSGFPHPIAVIAVGDALIAIPALLFTVVLAHGSVALQQQRLHLATFGDERYRVLSEAIGDLVLRYDRTNGVVMASQEAETLFGIQPRDLLGRGLLDHVHIGDRPALLTLLADAAQTGRNMSARLRLRIACPSLEAEGVDRSTFAWVEIRARRLDPGFDQGGALTCVEADPNATVVALVRDITNQIDHEIAIESAKKEAEQLSLWKDGFLANVSHELRTPLNAIIGFAEMLADENLAPREPEKQRDYARIITTSGHHLLSVVNSLLDISKIEAGCFAIDPEPFAFDAMVRSCCDMVGLKAEQAGIAVACAVTAELDTVIADKRACKQIVINLLSNALKFTPAGGTIAIGAKPDGSSVLLTVADTGVGIASPDLKRLGDAFFQAKSGLDRPYEGTGLGLSVVRGLVGLHGGTISIASAPGEGTRVTVRLPLDCRKKAPTGTAAKIETIPRYGRDLTPLHFPAVTKVNKVA